jgi:hypothetical protein
MSKFFDQMIVYKDFNKGRFGNQLFFVAATICASIENKTTYGFSSQMGHSGINYQNIFEDLLPISNEIPVEKYYQTSFGYEKITVQDAELIGYFQSEKFFKNCEKEIKKQFRFKKEVEDYVLQSYPNIVNSLSIHVRRGDYVNQPNHHPVIPISYYETILNKIYENYDFIFVFSDDLSWAKENFKGHKFIFPSFESNNDLYCFILMTLSQDIVIANSSYSWWAAWLNKNENKKVYAPHYKQWFGPSYSNLDTKDLIPENWIQIKYL